MECEKLRLNENYEKINKNRIKRKNKKAIKKKKITKLMKKNKMEFISAVYCCLLGSPYGYCSDAV